MKTKVSGLNGVIRQFSPKKKNHNYRITCMKRLLFTFLMDESLTRIKFSLKVLLKRLEMEFVPLSCIVTGGVGRTKLNPIVLCLSWFSEVFFFNTLFGVI